jgi:hypothetical protein
MPMVMVAKRSTRLPGRDRKFSAAISLGLLRVSILAHRPLAQLTQ